MSITKLPIVEFLKDCHRGLVLDVRSPGEYNHAHIPRALSLPIFDDNERKLIGTAYKQESREKAIKIGLDAFGKHMRNMVERVESLMKEKKADTREVFVHCWRGGMRSAAVAWLLDLYGFKVYTLNGGYKSYRNQVLTQFLRPFNFTVIGGYTGSDKTGILHELKSRGEKVIDLEGLALHKGSAFGNLGRNNQPSQEMFENLLAAELMTITEPDHFWIEDENQRIGDINIPLPFFDTLRLQPVLFIELPFDLRLDHLVKTYGAFEKSQFINGIVRIQKRLGGMETKNAINFLVEDDFINCFSVLLKYYDKYYLKSSLKRDKTETAITKIVSETIDVKTNADKIMNHERIRG
jgi:tRNA 2-selenouridine synthase